MKRAGHGKLLRRLGVYLFCYHWSRTRCFLKYEISDEYLFYVTINQNMRASRQYGCVQEAFVPGKHIV